MPRTAMRRRRETDDHPFTRALLEQHFYSRAVYGFISATAAQPDLLVDVDARDGGVVLDVGAYTGEWAEPVARRTRARIHAFEPNPVPFRKLEQRVGSFEHVTLHPYGLGRSDGTATLALEGPGASIYTTSSPHGSAPVSIRDVAGVLDELHIDDVDVMKVNIEGGEYDLFDRLVETDRLPRVQLVSVQFHEWHPHAHRRRRAIRRALRRSHQEVWCYPWVWELWQRRA
jgi:FkbM family methyltransferase